MKSLLITFLIFILIFTLLKMDIFDILSHQYFHMICYGSLAVVFACAIFFVGLPIKRNTKENPETSTLQERATHDEK